jgi:hypothetical protein
MKAIVLITVLIAAVLTAGQTGGALDLSLNNVTGSASSSAAAITLDSSFGQGVAGHVSTNGGIIMRSGFWAFEPLAPTAANVSVGGRVMTATGQGLPGVVVRIGSPQGELGRTMTAAFGYYRFDNVLAGETYIVEVSSKWYTFAEPARVVSVVDEVSNLDFVGAFP